MKKQVLIIWAIVAAACSLSAAGQSFYVKSISLRQNDLYASTNMRNDSKGKPCAVIKVGIVGVDDLQFPDAIGDVAYSSSEYVVYVPAGLKKLRYSSTKTSTNGEVDLNGIDITEKRTYSILLDNDNHLRDAIFIVKPADAKLTFNDQTVNLDENGMVTLQYQPGVYDWSVKKNGYITENGKVKLKEEELNVTTRVNLNQKLCQIIFNTDPSEALLFVDEQLSEKTLSLSEGRHKIRLTAEYYDDLEKEIDVRPDRTRFTLKMNKSKEKTIKIKDSLSKISSTDARHTISPVLGLEFYDKYKYNAYVCGGRYGAIYNFYFARVLSLHTGFSFGVMASFNDSLCRELNPNMYFRENNDEDKDNSDKTRLRYMLDIPLQLGFFKTFYYGKHKVDLQVGGYYRCVFREHKDSTYETETDLNSSGSLKKYKSDNLHDYGFRLTASVFFHKFGISVDLSKSMNKHGFWGGLSFAYAIPIDNNMK